MRGLTGTHWRPHARPCWHWDALSWGHRAQWLGRVRATVYKPPSSAATSECGDSENTAELSNVVAAEPGQKPVEEPTAAALSAAEEAAAPEAAKPPAAPERAAAEPESAAQEEEAAEPVPVGHRDGPPLYGRMMKAIASGHDRANAVRFLKLPFILTEAKLYAGAIAQFYWLSKVRPAARPLAALLPPYRP